MATISRNAPCPCGSGKKHKHCCLGKPGATAGGGQRLLLPLLLVVAGIGAGVLAGIQRSLGAGISVSAGIIIIAGLVWVLRDPPPPGQGGDPGAINFGGR